MLRKLLGSQLLNATRKGGGGGGEGTNLARHGSTSTDSMQHDRARLGKYDLAVFVFLFNKKGKENHKLRYSLSPGVWQSFVTIRSCNHLMRIISTYVDNTKKSEIS